MRIRVDLGVLLLFSVASARASDTVDQQQPDGANQALIAKCPHDMPPVCACVQEGDGIKVMPATEAYKSGKKILLVGPKPST